MERPIYLHVFDRELRTFTRAQLTDDYVYNVVLTASLLSDCIYMANSNLLESSSEFPISVGLVYEMERAFLAKVITTTDNPDEFLEKRKRLYHAVRDRYPMYFDNDIINFPSLPFIVPNSTTEYLRDRMLKETEKSISPAFINKYEAFRDTLSSKDDNAITIDVLNKHLGFVPPEWRYAANLISESYTVRYINVMNGCLMKHLAYISHFDYLCNNDLYYDCYYPVLYYAILKFFRNENGLYDTKDVVCKIVALRKNQYFQVFMVILQQSMTALHKLYEKRENDPQNRSFVFMQWRQVVEKYLVMPFSQLQEFDVELSLEVLIKAKDNLVRDFQLDIDMGKEFEQQLKRVLYVVATPTELKKVTDYYKDKGVALTAITEESHTYWNLGKIRKNQVYLVKCEMGSKKANASILTIDHAIRFLKPDYIIMVGIGFALKEDKLDLGDVMIASEIQDYGSCKMLDNRIIDRGTRVQADKTLLDRFTNAIVNWDGVPVRFGLVVTNDVLVNDIKYIDELRNRYPDAIGGEMEGCGLLANYQNPWILVKAVCDYGYHKEDDYQGDAAMNAIEYVDYVLREFDL
jgi:nucleoside phosphorylase